MPLSGSCRRSGRIERPPVLRLQLTRDSLGSAEGPSSCSEDRHLIRSWIPCLWFVTAACGTSERESPPRAATRSPESGALGGVDSLTAVAPAAPSTQPIQLPDQVAPPMATTDRGRVSVGLLRSDGLVVHVFAYRSGAWTEVDTVGVSEHESLNSVVARGPEAIRDSVLVPADWLVYGYDGSVRPFKAGAPIEIRDDMYDARGYATNWPADNSYASHRPNPRIGIAIAGPAQAAPLVGLDTTSTEWHEVVATVWPEFVSREEHEVREALAKQPCTYGPRMGPNCDPATERARWIAEGRLLDGHLIDSTARARGRVRMSITGRSAPGGLSLYHVGIYRSYPARDGGDCGPESYYQANVVRQSGRLAVTDPSLVFTDCDGKQTSGIRPLALLILGSRTFVIAAAWGWESGDTFIRELTAQGLQVPAGLR